jgi:hypothetical protein
MCVRISFVQENVVFIGDTKLSRNQGRIAAIMNSRMRFRLRGRDLLAEICLHMRMEFAYIAGISLDRMK